MPTEREVLTHMLRVAKEADERIFVNDISDVVIDGAKCGCFLPVGITMHLDPWLRNNTVLGRSFYVKGGYWESSSDDATLFGKVFRNPDRCEEFYRTDTKSRQSIVENLCRMIETSEA